MTASVQSLHPDEDVFLHAYLTPFAQWLAADDTTEIIVNRPGEIWIEQGTERLKQYEAPDITDILLQRLAEQVARISHQGINRERPLLGATLASGERIQFVAPSATRKHWAMAIRRHRLQEVTLDIYDRGPLVPIINEIPINHLERPIAFLKAAVAARKTILISGGTSSGKTTFLNALLREVSSDERVILVEDTPEIKLPSANGLGLVAVKGDLGEARVSTDDLLQAALRLRPDRIVLGELRGTEAVSFLRAINTGHPGSFTTIHANSPNGALEQLALMVMQSGLGLSRNDTIEYARSVIDIVVQLDRSNGVRGINSIIVLERN